MHAGSCLVHQECNDDDDDDDDDDRLLTRHTCKPRKVTHTSAEAQVTVAAIYVCSPQLSQ